MKGDFYLGDWLVQPSLGRVSLDGRPVQVRPKVMDLLVCLAGSPGIVISKETLLNEVWRTEAITESALTRTITELRYALADDVNQPRFLETIPKRGYRLIASVRPVVSPEESGPRGRHAPALAIWIAALLIVGSVALLVLEMDPAEPTETPRVKPLTSTPGQEGQPCFSPDGKQVAFVWNGETDNNFDIYVKRIGDDPPVRLTTDPAADQSPAWSADGRAIAFVRGAPSGVELYLVPAAGGGERFLGNLRRAWTPTTWMAPRSRILDWFPDGRALAVADQNSPGEPFRIFRLEIDTGERQQLTSAPPHAYGDSQPDVSPDGLTLAFTRSLSRDSSDIHVVPATGGDPRRLSFDNSVITGLAWTEDGRSIVFSSERGATAGAGSLWRLPVFGSTSETKLEQILGVGPRAIVPAIASRGGLLAYQESFQDTNLSRAPTSGRGSPERVIASTREETLADYSRDGAWIAFASNRSGNWEIWMANADGSNPRQVTSFARAPAMNPRWSPNGRLLAFNHAAEGNADIYTITPEGSSIRRLTLEPSREETPSWSRDGRWLYFSSNRSGTFEVWKLEVDRPTQVIQLTRGGGTNPFESPDGTHVYYRKGAAPGLEIYKTLVSGGNEIHVLGPIQRAPAGAWVPDLHGIYFIESWQIAYYRFATGRTTPIVTLPQDSIVAGPGLALSPDGRWLLYGQRDRVGSDIMLVEGFR
jgi:Tol biopolymer transport system component/DNA-binding winged helix-turn-helix (wHTH) protein